MKIASALLFIIFSFVAVANEVGLKQVADAAKSNSCEIVIPGGANSSFLLTPEYMIFWCKKNDEYGFYDLLAFNLKSVKWESCGSYIPVQSSRPMPIWVEKNPKPYGKSIHLNEFWYVGERADENKVGYLLAKDTVTEGSFNYGFFDLGQILYCHSGKWAMYGYH